MVVEGEAIATKTITPGQPPQQVKQYAHGDYFGELALLKGDPRAANVIAKTKLKVVSLDRDSFKRLLGPLDDILKRNMDSYINYLKWTFYLSEVSQPKKKNGWDLNEQSVPAHCRSTRPFLATKDILIMKSLTLTFSTAHICVKVTIELHRITRGGDG